MDIINFAAWIAQHKSLTSNEVDSVNDKLIIGKHVNDKRDGTQFQSFSISPQDLFSIAGDKRNMITVDAVYGDDVSASANVYKASFKNLDTAVAHAAPSDLVVVLPGTYYTGGIGNPVCDFYFMPNTFVINPFSWVFIKNDGGVLNIYGQGDFTGTGTAVGVIRASDNSTINIQADKVTKIGAFYACLWTVSGGTINAKIREVDASYSFANAINIEENCTITLEADILRHSWIGIFAGSNSNATFRGHINKIIAHNLASDFTGWGSVAIGCNRSGCLFDVQGDMFSERTIDGIGKGNIALEDGTNTSTIIHTGTRSIIRNTRSVLCTGGEVVLNSEIVNTQTTGISIYVGGGKVRVNSRLDNSASNQIPVTVVGGDLILSSAIIVAPSAAAESITASSAKTIKVYTGFSNKPLNANVTNSIAGTTYIVDPNIN